MPDESQQHSNDPTDTHEAFLRLWTHHEPELRAFVRSCCPRAQEVDEVMQDVSIAAWRKFSSLDDHDAFGAWACMIARYELLMTRRRFARDRLVLSEDIVKLLADEAASKACNMVNTGRLRRKTRLSRTCGRRCSRTLA